MKSFNTYIILFLFIVLSAIGFYNHEPWRDELQIWLIVTKSNSFLELYHNKDADHPFLLYIILYISSFFSKKIIINQIVHFLFSLASVALILKNKKFNVFEKIIITFGYFMFFEYTIIVRSYIINVFLILFSLYLYGSAKSRNLIIFPLILMAHSNILGLIIGISILFFLTYNKDISLKNMVISLFFMFLGFFDVLYQTVYNWGHFDTISKATTEYDLEWWSKQLSTIWRGFIPIPNFLEFHFWNTNIIDIIDINNITPHFTYFSKLKSWRFHQWSNIIENTRMWSYIIMSILLLVGICKSFWKDKKLIFLFFLGAIPMWILFAFIWHGSVRHHGHFFLLYLVCYWFLVHNGNQTKFSKIFLTTILILQIPGGVYAYYMDWKYNFSGSEKVANYINNNFKKDSLVLTGGYDYAITPISYHLDKDFYNPQSNKFSTFIDWSRNDTITEEEILIKADSLFETGNSVLTIINNPLIKHNNRYDYFELFEKGFISKIRSTRVIDFNERAIVKDENYRVYSFSENTDMSQSLFNQLLIKRINLQNEFISNDQCFYIDEFKYSENFYEIKGWSLPNNIKGTGVGNIYLLLTSNDNSYLLDLKSLERKDIEQLTNNYKNICSGFYGRVDYQLIPKSSYNLRLLIVDLEGNLSIQETDYCFDNN